MEVGLVINHFFLLMWRSLARLEARARTAYKLLDGLTQLRRKNFEVTFQFEGGLVVKLPHFGSIFDVIQDTGTFSKTLEFETRFQKEPLLRKIVYELYQTKYLCPEKSVIDIGCWLADNSVVWATFLDKDALVYAVDPSEANLEFGRRVATLNGVENIKWVNGVCADSSGIKLGFTGSIDHASFSELEGREFSAMRSTTLDEVVGEAKHSEISLLHVDVEGFEEKVIKGAAKIIEKSEPVIIFEQHIVKEDVQRLVNYLRQLGYVVFMINEVLQGCNLDCRNFVAFPRTRQLPKLAENLQNSRGLSEGIFYATLGNELIEVGE